MRKIVTAKDFEFSSRKEYAAEPSSLACAYIMHAQRCREKNVLAAAKREMVALSLYMRRYRRPVSKWMQMSVPEVQMRATLLAI